MVKMVDAFPDQVDPAGEEGLQCRIIFRLLPVTFLGNLLLNLPVDNGVVQF